MNIWAPMNDHTATISDRVAVSRRQSLQREVFEVLEYRYHRDGKGFQGAERTMCKGMESWWRDKYIYRSKTVPMIAKCKRVHSHVYSTALNAASIGLGVEP